MKLRVYSVRDRLTGFMTPTLDQSDSSAIRNFSMACDVGKRDTSLIAFRPADFSLYHVADFDTESGFVTSVVPLEFICSGDSLKE